MVDKRIPLFLLLVVSSLIVVAASQNTTTSKQQTDMTLSTTLPTPTDSENVCTRHLDCESCVQNHGMKCTWCPITSSCSGYTLIPRDCSVHWYVAQCTLKGYWLIVVAPVFVVLLLTVALCCCCRCCCLSGNKVNDEEQIHLTKRHRDKVKRQKFFEKRDADTSGDPRRTHGANNFLRTKYGLYNQADT